MSTTFSFSTSIDEKFFDDEKCETLFYRDLPKLTHHRFDDKEPSFLEKEEMSVNDVQKLWHNYPCKYGLLSHLKTLSNSWNKNCHISARYGQLPCLKYSRENGCEWDEDVMIEAIIGGHSDCVEYLLTEGCPTNLTRDEIYQILDQSPKIIPNTLSEKELIRWKHIYASKYGMLSYLKTLYNENISWYKKDCHISARYGHLNCLKFLREKGCEFDEFAV